MIFALLCVALAAEDASRPAVPDTPAEQVRFFETKVRPVLVEHCLNCHGREKQWGALRLDSRAALLKGGDSGAAVVPGKPDESLLIRAIRHTDDELKMPESGKLADAEIADLTRWVESGAVFPEMVKVSERTRDPNHWAFQPPVERPLPEVRDAAWIRSPVDQFILAGLEARQLAPTVQADKRTLIRRVTFDLTGLPPTPAEIDAFLADERPGAFSAVVDRLLETTAYGERWGRYWLDVARYADSNGFDENIAHGNAWRYRDYVVSAFIRDKPFNQFLTEQLAGDLLPADNEAERHEQLIATGFISIGPKVLAEVNQPKMHMDIVDEQIDTVGRVFMGLTLGCARCHDHKFDPIETVDYYGLAGVFKSTKTMDTYTKVARWHENELQTPQADAIRTEYQTKLAALKKTVEDFVAAADKAAKDGLAADAKPPEKLETIYPEATKAELAKLREQLAALEKEAPEYPSAMGVMEDTVIDVAVHVRGNPLKLGAVVPRHTPPVVRGPQPPGFAAAESGRKQLAAWLTDPHHPLTARVAVNRIWRWHFGTGLVRSTDNFGLLGERPTHPELLDWLALRFIADGWSMKALHRLLLNSSVYQQGSTPAEATLTSDPENRFYSRFNLRRLEAEAVRDSLLAVSGQLDRTMGGSLLKIKNRGYFFDHTSIDTTDYSSLRRSLYLPVVRNNVYDLFQLLDFPDPAVPTGDRATTTVAPQALLMLNSDFVMQAADGLAKQVLALEGTDEQRLNRAAAIVYGRAFTPAELAGHTQFLATAEQSLAAGQPDAALRRQESWMALCHLLLAANEFIYVR